MSELSDAIVEQVNQLEPAQYSYFRHLLDSGAVNPFVAVKAIHKSVDDGDIPAIRVYADIWAV